MLKLELDGEVNKWRVWSEENACYVLVDSTITAVTNFYRQQAIMRADNAVRQFVQEAQALGISPRRSMSN